MADHDDLLSPVLDCGPDVVHGRAGREPVDWLAVGSKAARELVAGFSGAEERAREDRVCPHTVVAKALAEGTRLLAPCGCQRPQLIGLTRGGLCVANEVEAHCRENNRVLRALACGELAAGLPHVLGRGADDLVLLVLLEHMGGLAGDAAALEERGEQVVG